MELSTGFLDADRFAYIPEDSKDALNRSRSEAWVHRWRHWRGRGMLDSTDVGGPLIDIPFVSCYEERGYQRRLFSFLNTHRRDKLMARKTFPINDVSLYFDVLDCPYDPLPFIAKPEFWAKDSCSKARVRANNGFFVGSHIFGIQDILPKHRPSVYVPVPSRWPKMSLLLSVPNPFVFSYHSRDYIRGTEVERNNVYWVARSQVIVFALIHFLAIARDGCSFFNRTKDPRFIAGYDPSFRGRLVQLDAKLIDNINRLGMYYCLAGSSLDLGCAVVALHQVVNKDWRPGGPGFLPYKWSSGELFSMAATTDV